ncbi:glycosyltransferase family protein [Flammeovirga kamogawensis]|uniref:Glycosyltransferase n=1 Tax=Flammeovirga kamogawensis TaxID=373891 RepID=A0ABX8GY15_9BACT|nr:glycosyltransferase [Flammeovirga kamogawensis]MBB6458894.1 spore maturation protein CgeB [Flammeovirga kamogawensis]QWG08475.1 glycosyltransferase [Flammeovirga kamogawensis]TRX66770.1 glycosyltransferase [Flammeovirga kamogawensis]
MNKKTFLITYDKTDSGLAYYFFEELKKNINIDLLSTNFKNNDLISKIKRKFGYRVSNTNYNLIIDSIKKSNCFKNIILFNCAGLNEEQINNLDKIPNSKLYLYSSDHLTGMEKYKKISTLKSLSLYDKVIVFSKNMIPIYYQYGAKNVDHIPFGYSINRHLNKKIINEKDISDDVVYFGSWGPHIEVILNEVSKFFNLKIYGNGWKHSKYNSLKTIANSTKYDGNTMRDLANKASVVINFIRAEHGCFTSMKTFELAASGACIITNYTEDQNIFFHNSEFSYFNTSEELKDKISFLLNNKKANIEQRKKSLETVSNYNYNNISKQLIDSLNL